MKKTIIFWAISIFLSIFIFVGLFIFLEKSALYRKKSSNLSKISEEKKDLDFNELARFCLRNEGEYIEIRPHTNKKERWHCIFPDKSECELEEFYKGSCKRGEKKCRDFCGDGVCQKEKICVEAGCICIEDKNNCPSDCSS